MFKPFQPIRKVKANPIKFLQAILQMIRTRSRSRSPSPSIETSKSSGLIKLDEHQSKKVKLENDILNQEEEKEDQIAKNDNQDLDETQLESRKSFSELYSTGLYLAPMVRIGTLTTRLLALEYGAALVWGPEIVDKAIIGSERIVNERTGTIQYTKNNGTTSIWQTHPREKSRLIYQIGSADPELALKAAQTVLQDVSGIDLNCGCPKDFSLKGGMGAALLKEPEKLCGILSHLVKNIPTHPISAKIRLLPDQEDTLNLVKQISATGISCLTVHCRTQLMRSTEPALLNQLKEIVETVNRSRSSSVPLPVVANGDCFEYKDMEKIKALTGVQRIMIARGAERNVSCFSPCGLSDPVTQIIPLFIKTGLVTGQGYANAKYCLTTMDLKTPSNQEKSDMKNLKSIRKEMKIKIQKSKDWESMSDLFGVNYLEAKDKLLIDEVFKK